MAVFNYHGKLSGLKFFYDSMTAQGVDIGTFCFEFNHVVSDVIFDTCSMPWKLIFIKRVTGTVLEIDIKNGFIFSIETNFKYREFKDFFCIKGGKGDFHIGGFKKVLNGSIPDKYNLTDPARQTISNIFNFDKEQEGIFPIGIINWAKLHINHPEWPSDKYHRSADNLKKTKQLYPTLFKATEKYDITIKYGLAPNEKTDLLKSGHYD